MATKKAAPPVTPLVLGGLLLLAVIWFFLPVLTNLFALLAESEDYSFGLLLPLVSGYIVYLKWPQIRNGLWRPSWMGLPLIALGLLLCIMGELSLSAFIARISFILVFTGLLVLVGGWSLLRLLIFPLLLLLLMIPGPEGIMKQLTFPLQLVSSKLAAILLQTIGIPVMRQGNVIDLGVRQLQIVQACSGLRYILSLMALGIIYCYFYQRSLWKAGILIISLIPSAIIANAIRVAAMGIFPSLQEGFLHSFSGWLIFIFCFGFMALLNWLLNCLSSQTSRSYNQDLPDTLDLNPPAGSSSPSYTPYLLVTLALVILCGPIARATTKVYPTPLLQSFDRFPRELGPWAGSTSPIGSDVLNILHTDIYLNADYTNRNHDVVTLWIAYYQKHGIGVEFIHNPRICMVGSGWEISEDGTTVLNNSLPVNYLILKRGGEKLLVYFWYLQQGHWVAKDYFFKFFMAYNVIINHRSDWALVRLVTPFKQDLDSAKERLNSFSQLLIPTLPEFIKK